MILFFYGKVYNEKTYIITSTMNYSKSLKRITVNSLNTLNHRIGTCDEYAYCILRNLLHSNPYNGLALSERIFMKFNFNFV